MAELTRNANLVGKMSLFILMPILIFTWLAGDDLLGLLSGGKFLNTGYSLAVLLLALIPLSQRQILETVAVACDKSQLCSWGASLGILVLPLAYWLLDAGYGLWGPITSRIGSHLIFDATLVAALLRRTKYKPDAAGFVKLIAASLLAFGLARQYPISLQGWLGMAIVAVLGGGCFLVIVYFFKPFSEEERTRLYRLLSRK
jgi:O-antigen/teichoic acid export membrane protein